METVMLKDYLIKDDQAFTVYACKGNDLYDSTQLDPQRIISSLSRLFPNDYEKQKKYLQDYYLHCRDSIKPYILMEYFTMQGDYETLEFMLEQEKERDLPEMRTWTMIYGILLRRQKGELSGSNLIDEIFKVKNTNNETLIFSLIIHLYGIKETGLFEPFHKVRRVLSPMVALLENEYLREAYTIRLTEMEVLTYLYTNKIELCREKCVEVLNRHELQVYFPLIYANFAHVLGQTFMFENYKIAKYWMTYGTNTLKKLTGSRANKRIQCIQNTIDFLNSYWGIDIDDTPFDKAEYAHRLIVRGKAEEAVATLEELRKTNGFLSSYQLFYYAIATENDELLSVSKEVFESHSNYFYLQLLQPESIQRYKNKLRGA